MYFVIAVSEDGDASVRGLSESELLAKLTPDQDGEAELDGAKAMPEIKDVDPMYWEDSFLIIRGEVIVPKPRQVVSTWEL